MSQKIDINIGGTNVGCMTFDESPGQLTAHRTATGFSLSIPATVELEYTDSSKPCPMLSNLCGIISADTVSGVETELGIVKDDWWYIGGKSECAKLAWSGLVSALTKFEIFIEAVSDIYPEINLTSFE